VSCSSDWPVTRRLSDPDARQLTNSKPNYSRRGEAIDFIWHQWAFVLPSDLPPNIIAEQALNVQPVDFPAHLTRSIEDVSDDDFDPFDYRALTALYNGEEQARSDEAQANARRTEAKNVKRAGRIKGISSILGAASSDSMLGRYGTMKSSAPMPSLPSAPQPSWQQVGADIEYQAAIQRAKDLAAEIRRRQGIK